MLPAVDRREEAIMSRKSWLALAWLPLLVIGVACSKSPTAPKSSRLDVYVQWNDQGVPDRRLEIVELGLSAVTDASGHATFTLPAGSWTLRAFVNRGGPVGRVDVAVTTTAGETSHVEVGDCLPCVSP
jgi:hypothetical protein